jgi:hypothetical protein
MCEDCKDNGFNEVNVDEYTEELNDEFISGNYENSFLSPIEIPFEYYDTDKFIKGIEEYSELAGKLTALINVGIHPSEALNYIMSKEINENNIKISEINKSMNEVVSKNQIVNFDKTQI